MKVSRPLFQILLFLSALLLSAVISTSNGQIIAQHDGDTADDLYFYLHDRLGSVREIIDANGDVVNTYTYEPFGEEYPTEANETVDDPFRFAGQFFDPEIAQYYLRARQYDPYLGRFTARDPVFGEFEETMTLHVYLYCLNDPINRTDPAGQKSYLETLTTTAVIGEFTAIDIVGAGLAIYLVHTLMQQMDWYNTAVDVLTSPIDSPVFSIGLVMAADRRRAQEDTPIGKLIPPSLTRGKKFPTELLGYSYKQLQNMQDDPNNKNNKKLLEKIKKVLKVFKQQRRLMEEMHGKPK